MKSLATTHLASALILVLFCTLIYILGTVTQTPSDACVGDSITVACVLTPPNDGDTFTGVVPLFIIGDSDTALTAAAINSNMTHPGVDLSRLTAATPPGGTTVRVSGTITLISYSTSDERLRLGCYVDYFVNGSSPIMNVIETLQLNQAGMSIDIVCALNFYINV